MVTTVTDGRVPTEQFPFGRLLREFPEVEIELERNVSPSQSIIPLFGVDSGTEEGVVVTLRTDTLVEGIAQLSRTPDRVLYSISWTSDIGALLGNFINHTVDLSTGNGTAAAWDCQP